jgi:ketosteroid isomerase-like protein
MSEENLELVRQIHERWDRGEPIDDLVADDVEYVNPNYAVEPGIRYGRDSFDLVRNTIEDFTLKVDRIVDAGGDEVVVLVHYTALGPGSGVQLSGDQGYIWTVEKGVAVRFRWFASHREALNAVGVYED